jgi:hypothetical protein
MFPLDSLFHSWCVLIRTSDPSAGDISEYRSVSDNADDMDDDDRRDLHDVEFDSTATPSSPEGGVPNPPAPTHPHTHTDSKNGNIEQSSGSGMPLAVCRFSWSIARPSVIQPIAVAPVKEEVPLLSSEDNDHDGCCQCCCGCCYRCGERVRSCLPVKETYVAISSPPAWMLFATIIF